MTGAIAEAATVGADDIDAAALVNDSPSEPTTNEAGTASLWKVLFTIVPFLHAPIAAPVRHFDAGHGVKQWQYRRVR